MDHLQVDTLIFLLFDSTYVTFELQNSTLVVCFFIIDTTSFFIKIASVVTLNSKPKNDFCEKYSWWVCEFWSLFIRDYGWANYLYVFINDIVWSVLLL